MLCEKEMTKYLDPNEEVTWGLGRSHN